MNTIVNLAYEIDPVWNIVRRIREDVKKALAAFPTELRDAGAMAASELIENAIKYAGSMERDAEISFKFQADQTRIYIAATNKVDSPANLSDLVDHIERISRAEDPKSLYIERLAFLINNPEAESTGLGLYRIAYEGAFDLSCMDENGLVTVIAVREIYPNCLENHDRTATYESGPQLYRF